MFLRWQFLWCFHITYPYSFSVLLHRRHFCVVEGVSCLTIFIGYVAAISLMPDIKRVYMYHGAEHKCINCIEQGMDLTVENVRKSSRLHKRCGTSFLLIVMLISIVFFLFTAWITGSCSFCCAWC